MDDNRSDASRPDAAAASSGPTHERRDVLGHLEGLRGVAVLGVLLFHLGVSEAQGGFVGVDVFFVLSGFLITGLLLRERDRTGRIDLATFYVRRARRILPAALVAIAITVGVSALVLTPLDVPRVTLDGAASALSVGNIRFALGATDYFGPDLPSPFRHFWSLGVEEQFYLFWPALVILATHPRSRKLTGLVIGAVVVASLAGSIALTTVSQPWAFYSFPTRAWQLGLGGLLAVVSVPSSGRPLLLAALASAAGLAGIVASFVLLDGSADYPGVVALLPSLAAAAVIVGGEAPGPAAALLGLAPVRWLGRISYSLYLWHWPLLTLPVMALGRPLLPAEAGFLAAAAVGLAWLSWRFVEEPFRRGNARVTQRRRTLAAAATAAMAVAVGSVGVGNAVLVELDAASASVALAADLPPAPSSPATTLATPEAAVVASATVASPTIAPTRSAATSLSPTAPSAATPKPTPTPTRAGRIPLPRNVQPPLTKARSDADPLVADGCGLNLGGSDPPRCVYGRKDGSLTVALVGDSHAEHWFPALERLAEERGWRLLPFTKYSCPLIDMRIYSPYLKREYTECEAWRPKVVAALQDAKPDLVVVASHRWFPTVVPGDGDPTRQGQALARLLVQLPGKVVLLADTPVAAVDVPACLSAHLADIRACQTSRLVAFGADPSARERVAAKLSGASLVDLSDVLCPGQICPVVTDGMIVFRDDHHLTATYSRSLADVLGERLPPLGGPQP